MSTDLLKEKERLKRQFMRKVEDPLYRRAIEESLGMRIEIKENGLPKDKRLKVAILVPSYKQVHPQMHAATMELQRYSMGDLDVYTPPRVVGSIPHWSRNAGIAELFVQKTKFDFVLFLDDDMVFAPDVLIRMVKHNLPIVAGLATMRFDPPLPNISKFNPETRNFSTIYDWVGHARRQGRTGEPGSLVKVDGVGAAVMLIRADVIKRMAEYYLNCEYELKWMGMNYETSERVKEGRWKRFARTQDGYWFDFLHHPYGNGQYGEDISFCLKAAECGFDTEVDTGIQPKHMGEYGFSHDTDYLRYMMDAMRQHDPSEFADWLKRTQPEDYEKYVAKYGLPGQQHEKQEDNIIRMK